MPPLFSRCTWESAICLIAKSVFITSSQIFLSVRASSCQRTCSFNAQQSNATPGPEHFPLVDASPQQHLSLFLSFSLWNQSLSYLANRADATYTFVQLLEKSQIRKLHLEMWVFLLQTWLQTYSNVLFFFFLNHLRNFRVIVTLYKPAYFQNSLFIYCYSFWPYDTIQSVISEDF